MDSKTTMLEQLTKHYEFLQEMGNGGHAVGYYRHNDELIKPVYVFPNGKFSIKHRNGEFFCWNYDPFSFRFYDEDVGKRTAISLKPESNNLAHRLGASAVIIQGNIVEVCEDHLKLKTVVRTPIASSKKIKKVFYSAIKNYKIKD